MRAHHGGCFYFLDLVVLFFGEGLALAAFLTGELEKEIKISLTSLEQKW
jgi:hypothetical protein